MQSQYVSAAICRGMGGNEVPLNRIIIATPKANTKVDGGGGLSGIMGLQRCVSHSMVIRVVGVDKALRVRQGGLPGVLLDAGVSVTSHLWELDPPDTREKGCWWQVHEPEQAKIYAGWAQSVLLKHRLAA